jgi:hypothetical protein
VISLRRHEITAAQAGVRLPSTQAAIISSVSPPGGAHHCPRARHHRDLPESLNSNSAKFPFKSASQTGLRSRNKGLRDLYSFHECRTRGRSRDIRLSSEAVHLQSLMLAFYVGFGDYIELVSNICGCHVLTTIYPPEIISYLMHRCYFLANV